MLDKIEIPPQFLADLKTRAEKATPGPWVTFGFESGNGNIDITVGTEKPGRDICKAYSQLGHHNCSCNAAFIAAANPAVVLALIEKIERLEEDFDAAARSAADESVKVVKLEKEADWLAEYSSRDECPLETLGWYENPEDCPQWCDWHYVVNDNVYGTDCSGGCAECWRRMAQEAIAEEEARIKESEPDA